MYPHRLAQDVTASRLCSAQTQQLQVAAEAAELYMKENMTAVVNRFLTEIQTADADRITITQATADADRIMSLQVTVVAHSITNLQMTAAADLFTTGTQTADAITDNHKAGNILLPGNFL